MRSPRIVIPAQSIVRNHCAAAEATAASSFQRRHRVVAQTLRACERRERVRSAPNLNHEENVGR